MNSQTQENTQTLYKNAVLDRRKFPRIELKRTGKVRCADGSVATIIVHDIAPDGIQFRCNKKTALRIHPSGKSIAPGQTGPALQLAVAVTLGANPVPVRVSGAMIYFALINPDVVAIGLKYGAMPADEVEKLDLFITESLLPRV